MRRMSGVLVVSMMLLLFTSCSDDSSDAGDPPTSSPPTSSSPTPTTSTPPEDETPEEFIRRWIDEDTRMQNTGETDAYLAMTWHCESCTRFAELVRGIYEKGGWIRTDGWTVESVRRDSSTSRAGRPAFVVMLDAAATKYLKSNRAHAETIAGGRSRHRLELVKRAGVWRVALMNELAS